MPARILDYHVLSSLSRDGWLLFVTRSLRLFGHGFLSVVLMLYLTNLGFNEFQCGLLFTLTLLGDTAVSLWITINADRIGRKKMLIVGAMLMLLAGTVFVLTGNFWILLIAATLGIISPSGNEVGPFLAIEQASLSQLLWGDRRTGVFAWYNLCGSVATAIGSLVAGLLTHVLHAQGFTTLASYRFVLIGYAAIGGVLALLFVAASPAIETTRVVTDGAVRRYFGLHRSRGVVFKLSALFSLDAFAGGFVIQAIVAYWFHVRFGTGEAVLGAIFFGANIFAGISALAATRLAKRFGLINTMVFTHMPANILLILVPLMPNLPLAIALLLLRFSISQMDVPTRQSYTMAVVDPDERSAAAGITGVARTTGASISPLLAGKMLASSPLFNLPFYLAGGLKLIYDLMLWQRFQAVKPREDLPQPAVAQMLQVESTTSRP